MDTDRETERRLNYQRKMQALHHADSVTIFKQQYFPADPFDAGVLVNAADLDSAELATVFQAVKALENEGNAAFANSLILYRHGNLTTMIRVNPLWVDARRQRSVQICELLHCFYWETNIFEERLREIVEAGDPQLLEYVQQIEEALNVSWLIPIPMPVVEDSPTILIEQEAQ